MSILAQHFMQFFSFCFFAFMRHLQAEISIKKIEKSRARICTSTTFARYVCLTMVTVNAPIRSHISSYKFAVRFFSRLLQAQIDNKKPITSCLPFLLDNMLSKSFPSSSKSLASSLLLSSSTLLKLVISDAM